MLPNFLIIGAPRSGTTHLYRGLRQHPEVFMSDVKEPMFFAYEGETRPGVIGDRSAYEALFVGSEHYKARGEASTLYLYHPEAPRRIRELIPEARLIAILRNPVDRAISQYTFQRFLKTEPLDTLEKALAAEEERRQQNAPPFSLYREVGLYSDQIARYLALFPREQLLFLLQDDLEQDPRAVFQHIFEFLGVDATFYPDLRHKTNASGIPQHETMFRLIKSAGRTVKRFLPERLATRLSGSAHETLLQHPPVNPATRAALREYFRADIARTQELIGRDLSHWLAP
ncbi:MAG: sulfotransferase [Firmicutes bacterium]|nr:sulfotransferase [Bacillota bacterium]